MKKILVILVALIGFCFNANADDSKTCKVKGALDGTVATSISKSDKETGKVTFKWSNDTDVDANVTIKIKVGAQTKTTTFFATRKSKDSDTLEFNPWPAGTTPSIESLSGLKCN